jgi:uncharacterized membrane protein
VIQDTLGVATVMVAVIAASLWICRRFRWAAQLSAVVWILLLAAVASNLGLIPLESELYGQLADFTVPFAVALILMKVNLGELRLAGKGMAVAFLIACVGTIVGVLLAGVLLDPLLQGVLGPDRWKVAGPYTGTYIGGSLNFFALWSGMELGRPDLFAAANAVDNLSLVVLLAFWMLVPSLLGHRFPVAEHWHTAEPSPGQAASSPDPEETKPRLDPLHVAALCLAALFVMWASSEITARWIHPWAPGVPSILVVTTLALALGQVPVVSRLEGAWEVGNLAFYLFFAAVGAMIHLYNAVVLSPVLFAYVLVVIVIHMAIIYGVGRLLRMDVGLLTVASTAAKAGPPLVLALAQSRGWQRFELSGVLVGLLGYAIGNYVGFAVAYLMRGLLGV